MGQSQLQNNNFSDNNNFNNNLNVDMYNNYNNKEIKIPSPIKILNINEYEFYSNQILSKMIYDYYKSGSDDEITLRNNLLAFKNIQLCPRVFVNVSENLMNTKMLISNLKFNHNINNNGNNNNNNDNTDNNSNNTSNNTSNNNNNKFELNLPICISPMAMQKMCHVDGECAMAKAASN
jgi:hypothetical protein